jgi:hypothetical protein
MFLLPLPPAAALASVRLLGGSIFLFRNSSQLEWQGYRFAYSGAFHDLRFLRFLWPYIEHLLTSIFSQPASHRTSLPSVTGG